MVFKNEKQLEKFLLQKCRAALTATERRIFNAIERCLVQYYGQFEPAEYIRTKNLYNSLVRTGVTKDGNGYKAEVYFDISALNYQTGPIEIKSTATTGRMGYATWSGQQVLDNAMSGSHGGYVEGVSPWDKSAAMVGVPDWAVTGEVKKLILQELQLLGVRIVS